MRTFRVLDTQTFLDLAQLARDKGYNRQLDTEWLAEALDPEGKHVVVFSLDHEHIRGALVPLHKRAVILARYWVKLWSDWKEKKRRGIDTIADAS